MFYIVPPWNSVYHLHLHVMVLPFLGSAWSFPPNVRRWGFASNRYNATPWQVMQWLDGKEQDDCERKEKKSGGDGEDGGGMLSRLFGFGRL